MKKLFLFLTIVFIAMQINAQEIDWGKKFQSPGIAGGPSASAVTVDTINNAVFVTGYFGGFFDADPGPSVYMLSSNGFFDIFIVKLDTAGNFQWAYNFGNIQDDKGMAVTTNPSGSVILTGYFQNLVDFDPGAGSFILTSNGSWDAFALQLDANGNFEWAKSFGAGGMDGCGAVVSDPAGNIYLPVFGTLTKVDPSGSIVYSISFPVGALDMHYDKAGYLVMCGAFSGSVDFDPGASSYIITATSPATGFVAKYDLSGGFVWAGAFLSNTYSTATTLTLDGNANVYAGGFHSGTTDFDPGSGLTSFNSVNGFSDAYLVNISSAGNFQWAHSFGGNGTDQSVAITISDNGIIYLAGEFADTVDFDPDNDVFNLVAIPLAGEFISIFDSIGSFITAKVFFTDPYGVASIADFSSDNYNQMYTTGIFTDTVDISLTATPYYLMSDILFSSNSYVAKYKDLTVGINRVISPSGGMIIYPNPAKNQYIVQLKDETLTISKIALSDLNGKKISVVDLKNKHVAKATFDSTRLKGEYIISVTDNKNKRHTQKLIIQ